MAVELASVEKAATSAGVPLSTFIRNAALTATSPIDVAQVHVAVEKLQRDFVKDIIAVAAATGTIGAAVELLTRLVKNLPVSR